jgi:hypothetical protein
MRTLLPDCACARVPCVLSADDLIQDRLVFAATHLKATMKRRDDWAIAASQWLEKKGRVQRAYDREVEQQAAAAASRKRAAEASSSTDDAAAPKKMRVTRDADAKPKHPGSICVRVGDTCIFHEICTNPTWTKVRAISGRKQPE